MIMTQEICFILIWIWSRMIRILSLIPCLGVSSNLWPWHRFWRLPFGRESFLPSSWDSCPLHIEVWSCNTRHGHFLQHDVVGFGRQRPRGSSPWQIWWWPRSTQRGHKMQQGAVGSHHNHQQDWCSLTYRQVQNVYNNCFFILIFKTYSTVL